MLTALASFGLLSLTLCAWIALSFACAAAQDAIQQRRERRAAVTRVIDESRWYHTHRSQT